MPVKIFLTGVTGYIGGDALHVLYNAHPEHEYAALVRTQDKADAVKAAYPKLRVVIGDLDDADLLKREASQADIVLHAADASDHEAAARAIAAGLLEGHTPSRPGYWLHTGGTGILTYADDAAGRLGLASDKVYDDGDEEGSVSGGGGGVGVAELTSLPDAAFHRNVDKVVLEAGSLGDVVRTVIVCPPTIYGQGRGPVSVRGRQVYEMAKLVLTREFVPVVGEGAARWNSVHIADLSDVFALLVEKAAKRDADPALWGEKGYLIVEDGEHIWADLAREMGKVAEREGFTGELQERTLGREEALEQAGFEAVSWGLNSRARAHRARRVLGWKPSRGSIEDELPNILKQEKQRLSV